MRLSRELRIIGAGISGTVNGWFMKDVGWAARRIYQERWLGENQVELINE